MELLKIVDIADDGENIIKMAVYEFPTEGDRDDFQEDGIENGFINPLNPTDPTDRILTGYEKYMLMQLGKILFFFVFHLPLP